MPARNWASPTVPENMTVNAGALVTTSGSPVGPNITTIAAVSSAVTRSTTTIDLGANVPNQRIGVLAQWVPDVAGTLPPANIEMEVQWSIDGTTFYPAPTSAQGDARSSLITTTGQERTLIVRGQVLTRYLRAQIRTPAAGIPAGKVYLWYARI